MAHERIDPRRIPLWIGSLAEARGEISKAAEHLFGRTVDFEERAFQALEVVTSRGKTPNMTHVWTALTESLPSIHHLYLALGVDLKELKAPWPKRLKRLDPDWHDATSINWHQVLREIFFETQEPSGSRERPPIKITYRLAAPCQHVLTDGRVGPRDLVAGMLSSPKFSRSFGRPTSNRVFRYIARAAGYGDGVLWEESMERLSKEALRIFDRISNVDSSFANQQFILYHDGKGFRIRPFGVFGAYQLSDTPLRDGSLWVARGNLIQPFTRFAEEPLARLEHLINSDTREAEFQDFFEAHPEFLLAIGDYARLHPQLVLHEDDGGTLIPDFFLEKLDSDFCDICDLKRPTADLVRNQRHRVRFKDAVMEAVSQVTYYRDWFEERSHRESFYQKYGLKAFRPRVAVIIGRRTSYYDEVERIKLESALPKWVELKTYDDIAAKARQWHSFVDS